jgi:hypothetical protein
MSGYMSRGQQMVAAATKQKHASLINTSNVNHWLNTNCSMVCDVTVFFTV